MAWYGGDAGNGGKHDGSTPHWCRWGKEGAGNLNLTPIHVVLAEERKRRKAVEAAMHGNNTEIIMEKMKQLIAQVPWQCHDGAMIVP